MATRKTTTSKPAAKKAAQRKEQDGTLDGMTGARALELLRGGRSAPTESEAADVQEEDFILRLGMAMLETLSPKQIKELRRAFNQVSDAAAAADDAAREAGTDLNEFDMGAADVEALQRVLSGE